MRTASQYHFSLELHNNKYYNKQKSIYKWIPGLRVLVPNNELFYSVHYLNSFQSEGDEVLQSILNTFITLSKQIGLFAWVCCAEIYGQANYHTNIQNSGGNNRWSSVCLKRKGFFCFEVLSIACSEDKLSFNIFFSCLSSVGTDSLLFPQNTKIPSS